ncbi:MAG TPA: hypothetical protein VJQ55_16820 [Candidatus Binatia bacterium]|nr:hypothetical protein [Candidatus Binatia bacterium]
MNRRALVLAADSAVTVSRVEQGKRTERYFKGSNKIFEVSGYQPIGAMIFDSADLQRVPWETIVKAFRSNIRRQRLGKVEDYAVAFFKFIEEHRELFPDEYRKELLIGNIDQAMIQALRTASEDGKVTAHVGDAAAIDAARNEILSEYLVVAKGRDATIIPQDQIDKIIEDNRTQLLSEATIDLKHFGSDSSFSPESLITIGANTFLKAPSALLAATGIVFAGFSDDEFFPSYVEFYCYGFVGDKLLFSKQSDYKISAGDSGYWNAFATTDMVNTFTMGFGPDVFTNVRQQLRATLKNFGASLQKEFSFVCPNLDDRVEELIKDNTAKWTDAVFEKHSRPLRGVIGSLPVEEMANLAETLVMLESLKEKVTQSSESVSGPIDVAVITKHEGLVWAKRKHFFSPELNPRYFERQRSKFLRDEG